MKGGRGKEGGPIEWTGWVDLSKVEIEANPGLKTLMQVPSASDRAEVIGP